MIKIFKPNPYMFHVLILSDKKPDYKTVQFNTGHQELIFPFIHIDVFFLKSNVERMCRSVEDQYNEIKVKDEQQTQIIHDLNMQKARLQTQNGEDSQGSGVWLGNGGWQPARLMWGPYLFGRGAEPPSGREGVFDFTANQRQAGPHPAAGGGQEATRGRKQGKNTSFRNGHVGENLRSQVT
jgi:hypothetical protein